MVTLYKPCPISGGISMLPEIGRHSKRTAAILNKMSIFKPENRLMPCKYIYNLKVLLQSKIILTTRSSLVCGSVPYKTKASSPFSLISHSLNLAYCNWLVEL